MALPLREKLSNGLGDIEKQRKSTTRGANEKTGGMRVVSGDGDELHPFEQLDREASYTADTGLQRLLCQNIITDLR